MASLTGNSSATNRKAQRFRLEQVVAVRSVDGELSDVSGVSRDISACGVFFFTDTSLPIGARVELFMTMPERALVSEEHFPLYASGRVVRAENLVDQFGIGVELQTIQVVAAEA